tara:strand:+ start:71 stop:295 length:225 start_codon:yes stop_codon:yes gene_type:complete
MNIELLVFNGYGQFIWPAFIFTFSICFLLYLKTKKDFEKQEKLFLNKFNKLQAVEIKIKKRKENTKEALSGISI